MEGGGDRFNKMKTILLIYPPYEGKNYLRSRSPFPIGPLYLASYLKIKGKDALVMDMSYPPTVTKASGKIALQKRYGWTDEEIKKWLKLNLPHFHNIVGVSTLMSSNYIGGYRVVELIKEVSPKTIVIMGGPHATAHPDHIFKNTKTDFICIGEGEEDFNTFLDGKNLPVSIIPRQQIVDPKTVREITSVRSFISDMNSLPYIRREQLCDDRHLDEMMITFSRGCPHKCTFCGSRTIQGNKWRTKTTKYAVDEIAYYVKTWKVTKFLVEDDNPSPGKPGIEWLKEFCKLIIDKNKEKELPKLRFHVSHGLPVYAVADKKLTKLLWEAGFRGMVFPLESADPAVLSDMKKEFTPDAYKKAIKNWGEHDGHPFPTNIILGYPFVETIESMLETMKFVANNGGLIWASHFRLNRGIPLFERCLEAGYVKENYDPINSQKFFIETERFSLIDLAELMQISRGINFGTEHGFNIFKDDPSEAIFKDFQFRSYYFNSVAATGSFNFNRSQTVFCQLLLLKASQIKGRPKVRVNDFKDSIIYDGVKPSLVYMKLKNILDKKREKRVK